MINDDLKKKITSDVLDSYKSSDNPNFHFVLERQSWYNNLILNIRSLYQGVNDWTDLNCDVSKSIEINDQQKRKTYLYLSFVGKYSFLLIDDVVFANKWAKDQRLEKLVQLLRKSDLIILTREELWSSLPIEINFDEDLRLSTVLGLLFSPGLELPSLC